MVSRLLDRANFDDKEEAINKRCVTFQEECRPVLDKYQKKLVKVCIKQSVGEYDLNTFSDQRRAVGGESC